MKFVGIVKKNLGRGTKLGFPTANIDAPEGLEEGIFVGLVYGAPALIFVGAAKTFGETERKAEVYILDFSADIYGREIEVETIKKIRDNQKFESEAALVEQMKRDEEVARAFFKDYNLDN